MSIQSYEIHSNPSAIWLHIGGLCPTHWDLVEDHFRIIFVAHGYYYLDPCVPVPILESYCLCKRGLCRHHIGLISHCLLFHNRSQSRKLLITIEPDCKRIAGLLIFHVGCVWILSIVFGLYNCGIWHRGCSITYTPPYAKKLCQKELCRLLLDYANCNWIVQLYLDCTIVIGLYDCNWIVRLYLDCTIIFGLYYCTWII